MRLHRWKTDPAKLISNTGAYVVVGNSGGFNVKCKKKEKKKGAAWSFVFTDNLCLCVVHTCTACLHVLIL